MATEAKSSAAKIKSGLIQGDSSTKSKKVESLSNNSRLSADSKQKSVSIANKTEVKSKTVSGSSKTKITLTGRVKKVFSLAGQKFDPPEKREPLRIFYESLSKQKPSSEMAEFWMMEHGLLSPERAKKAYEKKQRKQKMQRLGTPIKPSKPAPKPESPQKQQQASRKGEVKANWFGMCQELRNWLALGNWKSLSLVGIAFSVVIMFQCFELPNGGSLLFAAPASGKDVVLGNGSLPIRASLLGSSNATGLDDPVFPDDARGRESDYGEEDVDGSNASVPEAAAIVDISSGGVDGNGEASSPDQLGGKSKNLTQETYDNFRRRSVPKETGKSSSQNNVTLMPKDNKQSADPGLLSVVPLPPMSDSPPVITLEVSGTTISLIPLVPVELNESTVFKDADGGEEDLREEGNNLTSLPPPVAPSVPEARKSPKMTIPSVVTISDMNQLLLQSLSFPKQVRPRWSSPVDRELLHAKSEILHAPHSSSDPDLYAPLFRNVSMFRRSYELMEETLKVYVYKEGEKPFLHQPDLKGIYASEGWFMKLMEANKKFITKNPRKAHLFYMPFSSRNLEETLYVPNSHSHKNLIQYLKNYLDVITAKYPFWSRIDGADHFLVGCHDWASAETKRYISNCIRAICNSDVKEGFAIGKDVSLPETFVRSPQRPLKDLGGKPASQRSTLAFFAGNMHGYLRPILFQHWGDNKDPNMKIFGRMPKAKNSMNYIRLMQSSKYCICAKGYEVNSPRVVEAIFYECVPVIISDDFVPPLFSILNWESFAVFVMEKDIPNLKNILLSIPERRYLQMQMRVKKVQQHFLWHSRPVKYDLFHMILHSIWYSRVFRT